MSAALRSAVLVSLALGALVLLPLARCATLVPEYHRPPAFPGQVWLVPLPAAGTPLDVARPARVDGERAALTIDLAYARDGAATTLVADWAERTTERVAGPVATRVFPGFDFDGDGTEDGLARGLPGEPWRVVVDSGRTGAVLFDEIATSAWAHPDRIAPLGDLDGDGCAELAIATMRRDRSAYDLHLYDMLHGGRSFVAVVSGAEAVRARRGAAPR